MRVAGRGGDCRHDREQGFPFHTVNYGGVVLGNRDGGVAVAEPQMPVDLVGESLRYQSFWNALPSEFEAKDFKAIAEKVGLSTPTAERYIKGWTKTRLYWVSRGHYRKR